MDTFIKIAQFLLSLSLLIVLHEWGHYFFARLFKTRVNKFYLFFDFLFPVPTLLNFALWKKKKGDTEFGIGWFPLGGYVQIDGMQDETQDAEKLKSPPQPWEFRSKKAWQRLLIMMGGIIVNVLVAFVIYAGILFVWGEKRIINSSLKNGIAVGDSVMYKFGFKDGDKIAKINGDSIKYFDEVSKKLFLSGKDVSVDIIRDGKNITTKIPDSILGFLSTRKLNKKGLINIAIESVVDSIKPESSVAKFLQKGDKVVRVNTDTIINHNHLVNKLQKLKSRFISLTVFRESDKKHHTTLAKLDENYSIGFFVQSNMDTLQSQGYLSIYKREYGFFESLPAGVSKTFQKLGEYIDQFKLIFSPSTGAWKGMGGFASMTQAFTGHWDWEYFWGITAFFSVALAFMNFLPIPMLDGGYILFTLFEMITGKKVPDKFLEKANTIGFFIIIGLMLFTNGNDVFRKFKGWF
ncbi:MAG: RIP metalloprotease RseP [Ferruginibacter sp.]|nr:RIP metalloprotease RseP [Ferruginibacter sp.]